MNSPAPYGSRSLNSPIVQLVERWTVNPYVAGSSPARGAISCQFRAPVVGARFVRIA